MKEKDLLKLADDVTKTQITLCSVLGPEQYASFLTGMISNVVGNMPEQEWKEFTACHPCTVVGCDCHIVKAKIVPFYATLREDHKRYCPKPVNN